LGAEGFQETAAEPIDIPPQPYFAGVTRAVAALDELGAPVSPSDRESLKALSHEGTAAAVMAAERILHRYTLARVKLDREGYAQTLAGGAEPTLVEQGWQVFLVRIRNPHGLRRPVVVSTTAVPGIRGMNLTPATLSGPRSLAQRPWLVDRDDKAPLVEALWIASEFHSNSPLLGFELEYKVLQLFSRDHGTRSAYLAFSLVEQHDAIHFGRQGVQLDFDCKKSRDVLLTISDADGLGCVASLVIKDAQFRTYPPQAMRLAPDMRFHAQIYRGDGETVRLPDGEYSIVASRGPEYLPQTTRITVSEQSQQADIRLKRWVDPADFGWYAGETHIHAAGCSHYDVPTEGVSPETMIRQVRGEALAVGNILTWGPCYYYQREFFTGQAISPAAALEHPELQRANNSEWVPQATAKDHESVIRYDVEISGFPSSHAGHLVLLRLQDQDYPGTHAIQDWPSWNLPILRWAHGQDAVSGYAHCAIGMAVDSTELPNFLIPGFGGNGTNEAIVDVTHGVVDFLSGAEALPAYELNAWYHLLNCGYRLAMVGETDYPCIFDERVGMGRSYVQLESRPTGNPGYEAWIDGVRKGRFYFGDGRSHFLQFAVTSAEQNEREARLQKPGVVTVVGTIAAWLDPQVTPATQAIRNSAPFAKPAWHLERARIDDTREVDVELVLNGVAVSRQRVVADGSPTELTFDVDIEQSSWIALRVLPSGHTYPIFVLVDDAPIRASRRSAQWCRECVDKIWQVKSPFIREEDRLEAMAAFDHARETYDAIASECSS